MTFLNEAFNLNFTQSEVDFVIPNLEEDINLYVDPHLFYKSKIKEYNEVQAIIHNFFDIAINQIKNDQPQIAKRMMSFPEVKETMLGLSSGNHSGRGMGKSRGEIIYNEIISNEHIQEHGIEHLSEMQLLVEGVGFDMISDMCTNIAKEFFIKYTQQQCKIHGIPMEKDVVVEHIFDWDELEWDGGFVELPINPLNNIPIILVPKKCVRRFADIDYKDFWNRLYRHILMEKEKEMAIQTIGKMPKITWKEINEKYNFSKATVIEVLHEQPHLMNEYFVKKDKEIEQSSMDLMMVDGVLKDINEGKDLISELDALKPGNKDAKKYESLMVRILSLLFKDSLDAPHEQVYSQDGREIVDVTFYNSANQGFWNDMKMQYQSLIIPIEFKNMMDISNTEIFQISARLSTTKGLFGIMIVRDFDIKDIGRIYRRLYLENKVVLLLNDDDIKEMLRRYDQGLNVNAYMREKYRKFIEEA